MNQPTRHNPLDNLDDDEAPVVPVPRKPMLSKEEAARVASSQGFAAPGAAVAPVAAAPAVAPAAQNAGDVPRALRKRKEPITVTVDPQILADFDKRAQAAGLSRAAALGLAMRDWTAAEDRKARE